MKWTIVLLLVISLCYVHTGLSLKDQITHKKLLLVGPEGSALVYKYCNVPMIDVAPLREYTCTVNNDQVVMVIAPAYEGIRELNTALKSIRSAEFFNLVVFLWPQTLQGSFDPYVSVALSFLPYIKSDPRPFVAVVPETSDKHPEWEDFKQMVGINTIYLTKKNSYLMVFENVVHKIDAKVHVDNRNCPKGKSGCLASLNVVETKVGLKMIKDVEVGDEILTPRGYMPVIYVEDHPNVTIPCVHVGGIWLTADHFIYTQGAMTPAGELANTTMQVNLEVRTVVVKGDSFFCGQVLVSSYSRFRWLPSFSFVIDHLPTSIITLSRRVTYIFL